MIKLFFDIETIPCDDSHKLTYIEILRNKKKFEELDEDEIHRSTSFDGTFGRLCCIGVIKEGPQGTLFKDVLRGTEKEMLTQFWELGKGVFRFVGHNVWGFDMPFLVQRSIINGVRPLPINFRRYVKEPLYDTMLEWTFWNLDRDKFPKLDTLAKVLGFPTSKDEMDGSEVWDYYKAGKLDEICTYCMKDVELTRKVYYKMTFEQMPEEKKESRPLAVPVKKPGLDEIPHPALTVTEEIPF